jgi:hypothetical protein
MHVIPFPIRRGERRGVIHVMGDRVSGFEIGHESASGNSWGSFSSYASGQEAITAAYALNRDDYEGVCDVFVCDAALQDANRGVGLPSIPGDF